MLEIQSLMYTIYGMANHNTVGQLIRVEEATRAVDQDRTCLPNTHARVSLTTSGVVPGR